MTLFMLVEKWVILTAYLTNFGRPKSRQKCGIFILFPMAQKVPQVIGITRQFGTTRINLANVMYEGIVMFFDIPT